MTSATRDWTGPEPGTPGICRAPTAEEQALKKRMLATCQNDRLSLLVEQPFTARLIMNLELVPVVDDRLRTAGTDGTHVFFNAHFMAGLSEPERRFILAHEVWHCAMDHFGRRLGRDVQKWNVACDFEVNDIVANLLGFCPRYALHEKHLAGLSAEEIYSLMDDLLEPIPSQPILDTHDVVSATLDVGAVVTDPDFRPAAETRLSRNRWQRRLIAASNSTPGGAGSLPRQAALRITQLRGSTLAWQVVLRRFLQRSYTDSYNWLSPSRRHIHAGRYLPGRRGNRLDVAVAVDASASCVDRLPRFLAELRAILGSFTRCELRLISFDTEVGVETQMDETALHRLDRWTVTGGGGTDFMPVFAHFDQSRPTALVMLTDGLARVPDTPPAYPVLWVLGNDDRVPCKWGQQVRLSSACD